LSEKEREIEEMLKQGKTEAAAENQKKADKGIEDLKKELEKLAQSEELEKEIKEALQNLSLQAGNLIKEASPAEKEINLNQMAAELEKLYESLTKGRFANLRKNLLENLKQMIETSKAEERLMDEKSSSMPRLQDEIIQATRTIAESLYTQEVKSLYVSPQIGKGLARAISKMEKAKELSGSKKSLGEAKRMARDAMEEMNLVALGLIQSLKKASQGSSSTGMDKFMQALSEISKGQISLNQSLFGIFPLPVGGLTPQQQAQLRRLAGAQKELREALEGLKGKAGGKHQDLIDNLAGQMQKTEEELYQYKFDRKLIERQKKILSRLLDAQKSIRREDYTKKRKSRPGEDIIKRSPDKLPQDLGRDELREIIQQALKQPYPKEYELYIREYFRALLEERLEEKNPRK
jgi:hypothetical protein